VKSPSFRTAGLIAASVGAVVLIVAAVWSVLPRTSQKIDSLAVLPFVNVTGDPNSEYLSDGLTENLIGNLSHLPDVAVRPRSSVWRYKGKDTDPQALARELKVAVTVSGRVTLRGDALLVGVEMTDTRNNRNLWSEQYDRKLSDLLSIQREIAAEVSARLREKLAAKAQAQITRGGTADPQAYQLYLKGRYYWDKRTLDAVNMAGDFFNQAIAKDPGYALAYVGLADYWIVIPGISPLPAGAALPKLKAAAEKALSLDDELPAAHLALAMAYLSNWEWAAADREFQRTLELDPRLSNAHHWYGGHLSTLARHQEAISHLQRAVELEPFNLQYNSNLARAYANARMYDQAIIHYKKTSGMDPNFANAHGGLSEVYLFLGRYDEWLAEWKQEADLKNYPAGLAVEAAAERGYSTGGYRAAMSSTIDQQLKQKKAGSYVDSADIAYNYAALGAKEKTLRWLETALAERSRHLALIKIVPDLDPFRSDPRYLAILRRMGLPE
jgi:TolB-like protein